eukprot:gene1032-744_t
MSSCDQFDVLDTLGTGSFGTVSRIRRKADGKLFVWKEINFGNMSEREKAQLVAEVNILRELRSPFIVKYHDRIVDKPRTRLYIIMEYCAGGDLSAIIKRNRQQRTHVEESFIWKILAQSILALKDCHRRVENGETKPVLHRDLKPANILLDAELNVKMADFGLAKELSSNTQFAQTNVGTPFYMAPEIINDKKYDEKSDIWSLGCLLYELASLRPPFEAANAVSLAVKINQGRFTRIPTRYSDALFDVIRQMIQLEPRRRPRVEDLENLPALQAQMVGARNIWNDYRFQHMQASKLRELRTKEDTLNAREEALNAREAALNTKEQQLAALEQRLKEMQQRLGQATDAATAAAAGGGGGGGLTSIPSNVDLNSQAAKASYDAAKIQAYRRRVYGSAPVYETAASHKQQRQPLQTLKIATGAENAKENIQPAAALPGHHNVFKFAANGGVHKPHGRALPYDFQPDAEDTSPLKKQRVHSTNDLLTANNNHHMGLGLGGGFRYPSSNAGTT